MHEEVQFEPIDSSVTCFQGLYLPRLGMFLHVLSMVFGVRKCPLQRRDWKSFLVLEGGRDEYIIT